MHYFLSFFVELGCFGVFWCGGHNPKSLWNHTSACLLCNFFCKMVYPYPSIPCKEPSSVKLSPCLTHPNPSWRTEYICGSDNDKDLFRIIVIVFSWIVLECVPWKLRFLGTCVEPRLLKKYNQLWWVTNGLQYPECEHLNSVRDEELLCTQDSQTKQTFHSWTFACFQELTTFSSQNITDSLKSSIISPLSSHTTQCNISLTWRKDLFEWYNSPFNS